MKISFAIPTHNRADLLGPSIDSVFAVDIPAEVRALELIVIDNNCTDNTADVVRARMQTGPFNFRLRDAYR